ncbi:MAG: hypothetical protein IT405_02840 [Candidatus Yanofskybacteria bacterium]|nr:hypothetical protein [Candidatus Yanofskybacteria bacterium]
MKIRALFVAVLAVTLCACSLLTGPSDVTSFMPKSVSPAPGSVLLSGTKITITGPLSVQPGLYYTMLYVRDDGAVFLSSEWGPSGENSSWPDYRFSQGVGTGSQDAGTFRNLFCYGSHTVTNAVFVTSGSSILRRYMNSPELHVVRSFDWSIVSYRADIPLNYSCR